MDGEFTAIAQGAVNGEGERPSYLSSPNGMAFTVGLWAKEKRIHPHLVHESRGYSWILNKEWKLDFKDNLEVPRVTKL